VKKIETVIFDYGGVLANVLKPSDGFYAMAQVALDVIPSLKLSPTTIAEDIKAGWTAYDGWKIFQSRRRVPLEMSQSLFWELVTHDWEEGVSREAIANAALLTRELELRVISRPASTGAGHVLKTLRDRGKKLALASNCLSGDAARFQLQQDGLLDLFDATLFSDEVGYRKPGPELLRQTVAALGGTAEETCFVGDRIDRDIQAGRRAGMGLCVLKIAPTGPGQGVRGVQEDYAIRELSELLTLPEFSDKRSP
jgi:FMN phosphatase YigB (HAD superfamily)